MSTNEMPSHLTGYVVNFLTKNFWKVERTMTRSDAMQEAYVVFLRCKAKYPDAAPAHFTALFKTAWGNEFTDLANADTSSRVCISENQERSNDGEGYQIESMGEMDNDGMLATMIRQAPREVVMVLNLFLNAPQELLDLALTTWRAQGRYRAGGSKQVSRMLGLPEDYDVMQAVEDYFRPNQH